MLLNTNIIDYKSTKLALSIASFAHNGQLRKGSNIPYINHVINVDNLIDYIIPHRLLEITYKTWNIDRTHLRICAYLHDSIEDCKEICKTDIQDNFTLHIADTINILSYEGAKHNKASLEQYHINIAEYFNHSAHIIKMCDLWDNITDFGELDDPARFFDIDFTEWKWKDTIDKLITHALPDELPILSLLSIKLKSVMDKAKGI